MSTKFKILPFVALGLFWMAGADNARSNIANCEKAFNDCQARGGNHWWACSAFKDFETDPNDGAGQPFNACCSGRNAKSAGNCSAGDCTSAKYHCDRKEWF